MASTFETNSIKAEYNMTVADLRSLKEEQDNIKFKLDQEEFHLEQLPFRRGLEGSITRVRLLLTVVYASIFIVLIISIIYTYKDYKDANASAVSDTSDLLTSGDAASQLGVAFFFTFLLLLGFGVLLFVSIVKLLPSLSKHFRFGRKKMATRGLGVTFSEDKEITEGKIRRLKSDVDDLDRLIMDRTLELDKIKRRMIELGVEIPISPYEAGRKQGIGSKDYRDDMFTDNTSYLTSEQLNTRIHDDNLELEHLCKLLDDKKAEELKLTEDINRVYDRFEAAKAAAILTAMIIVACIVFTFSLSWVPYIGGIFSVVGITTFVVFIYRYRKYYEKDFDNYFVERKFDFFKSYAFSHDLKPISDTKANVTRERKRLENNYHKVEERLSTWLAEKDKRENKG